MLLHSILSSRSYFSTKTSCIISTYLGLQAYGAVAFGVFSSTASLEYQIFIRAVSKGKVHYASTFNEKLGQEYGMAAPSVRVLRVVCPTF